MQGRRVILAFFLYQVHLLCGLFGGPIVRCAVVGATTRKLICEPAKEQGASFARFRPELRQGVLGSDSLVAILIMYYNYLFVKASVIWIFQPQQLGPV